MEEAAAVLVGRQRIGRVGRDGVMGGRGLAVHGGQTAAQGAAALHLHPVCQRDLVFNRLFVIHPGRGGGGGSGAGVWGHVFRGRRGEAVEVRARVRRWSERRDRSRAGAAAAAAAGVARAGAVQGGFAEVADRPCVVVVSGGQGCFPGVKPRNTGAVDEVWSADLVPSQAS